MALTAAQRARAAAYARSRTGNTGAVVTGAGRSTTSSGYGTTPGVNQTARDEYWGTPASRTYGTTADYNAYRQERGYTPYTKTYATPATPSLGGSGYGRGGGGGGGGGAAMTQAMFDSMLKALGTMGPKLNLPDFRGAELAAFNAAPYTQATTDLDTAVAADIAASQAATTAADQALRANYTNAYQAAPVTQAPVAQQVGAGLQATAGGGGDQAAVAAQSNQAAQSDQASFANLLNVLAAADQSAQTSRLSQVQLDRGAAQRGIEAQQLGLQGGINQGRTRAQTAWQQAAEERRYQNQLMQQQIAQQEAQGNWQQRNEMISSRLAPLLQLLQGAGRGVNTTALQQLLAGWQK